MDAMLADLYESLCYGEQKRDASELRKFFMVFMQCVDQGCMPVPDFATDDACVYVQRCLAWLTTYDPQAKAGFDALTRKTWRQNVDALAALGVSEQDLETAARTQDPRVMHELVARLARARGYTNVGLTLLGVLGALLVPRAPQKSLVSGLKNGDVVMRTGAAHPDYAMLNVNSGEFRSALGNLQIPGTLMRPTPMYPGEFVVRLGDGYHLFSSLRVDASRSTVFDPAGFPSFNICFPFGSRWAFVDGETVSFGDQQFAIRDLRTSSSLADGEIGIVVGDAMHVLSLVPDEDPVLRTLQQNASVMRFAQQRGIDVGSRATL